jgi:hypothetical protein
MAEAFDQARSRLPGSYEEGSYRFADRAVRLRVVGSTLWAHVARPFAQLRGPACSPAEPGLSLCLWDEQASGIGCPEEAATVELDRSWAIDEGSLSVSRDGRYVCFRRPRAVTWLDRQAGQLFEWRASAETCSIYERTKPLRVLLPILYADLGVQLVHGALIARGGEALLIVGPSGAGKSTAALAALCGGYSYLGDDYVGLEERGDGTFVGHSFYSSARLELAQLARFPSLRRHAVLSDDPLNPKALLLVAESFPHQVVRSAAIRAVVLPRVVDDLTSCYRPATRGQALFALAPSSLILPLHAGRAGLDRLGRLVERVPAYWLECGSDLSRIPASLTALLLEAELCRTGR